MLIKFYRVWTTQTQLPPIVLFLESFELHLKEILNYFIFLKVQNNCNHVEWYHRQFIYQVFKNIEIESSAKIDLGKAILEPHDSLINIFSLTSCPFSDCHGNFPGNKNGQPRRNSLSSSSYMLPWNTQIEAFTCIVTADINWKVLSWVALSLWLISIFSLSGLNARCWINNFMEIHTFSHYFYFN